jgi:hypothetical protein
MRKGKASFSPSVRNIDRPVIEKMIPTPSKKTAVRNERLGKVLREILS